MHCSKFAEFVERICYWIDIEFVERQEFEYEFVKKQIFKFVGIPQLSGINPVPQTTSSPTKPIKWVVIPLPDSDPGISG